MTANKFPLFNGVPIDPWHPVVHWENAQPSYVMPHTDDVYGHHAGGFVDRDEAGNIIYGEPHGIY